MKRQEILRLTTDSHRLAMEIRHLIEWQESSNLSAKEKFSRIKKMATEIENINGVISHPDKYPPLTES